MNTKLYCALAVLACTTGCAAAEGPVVSSGSPESDFEISIWTDFTTAWNRSHETEYAPPELRAQLPGVTTADVAWVLAERDLNEDVLVATRWSPEHLLLEVPGLRLAGKAVGDVASLSVAFESSNYATTPTPVWATDSTEEDLLWSSLEETLGDVASLRGTAPAKELLWLRIAQDLDEQAWRETRLTADDLLSMPSYGLLRKMIADGMAEMTITSVLGTDASVFGAALDDHCQIFHDTLMDVCEVIASTLMCRIPILAPICRNQLKICECKADCTQCVCLGGAPEGGNCHKDCCDTENDCVPP